MAGQSEFPTVVTDDLRSPLLTLGDNTMASAGRSDPMLLSGMACVSLTVEGVQRTLENLPPVDCCLIAFMGISDSDLPLQFTAAITLQLAEELRDTLSALLDARPNPEGN